MAYITWGSESKLYLNMENGYLEQVEYAGHSIPLHSRLWRVFTTERELGIGDMTHFHWEQFGQILKLYWRSEAALVTVTLREGKAGKLYMGINVQLYGEEAVNKVQFPVLDGMRFDGDDYLMIPWQNGRILKNAVDTFLSKGKKVPFWVGRGEYSYENEYPAGLSYQFMTFYAPEEVGYYLAAEDPDAYIKTFVYEYHREQHALNFMVTNYPEGMGLTKSYCVPYEYAFTMFRGDWQTAALIYRDWATGQKWCKTPLRDRKLPRQVTETDLWRINHTNGEMGKRTQEYFDTSVMLRDAMDCKLALHWYGWSLNVEHDYGTPDYFNKETRESGWAETLKQWNRRFTEEGIVKIPYTNPRLWSLKSDSWIPDNAAEAAVKTEDGNMADEPWSVENPMKTMCPTCALMQNKMVEMCRRYVLEEGFDGAYLDQIASFNAMLCFDRTHAHPVGGGRWWNDANHQLINNIKNMLGEEMVYTTESCCESYADLFDLFLVLDTCFQYTAFNALSGGNAEAIPLFSLIYSGYALSYGSICKYSDRIDRFEFNYIRNIIWGILPSVEGIDMEEFKAGKQHLEVTKRGVDFFKAHKEMFLYGQLLELPAIECDTLEMDWDARDEAGNRFSYTKQFPAVIASLWKDADGRRQLFAYNYSEAAQTICYAGQEIVILPKSFGCVEE